ncbi:MAG: HD domain-containing protein [Desulfobacterales bacterium]|nr:HD domain-containing protein [Desulfobacterales bacterium]
MDIQKHDQHMLERAEAPKKWNILCISQHSNIISDCLTRLNSLPFDLLILKTTEDAQNYCLESAPDMVICDADLPNNVSSIEAFCKWIKINPKTQDVWFVLICSETTRNSVEFQTWGVDDCFFTPIFPNSLIIRIRHWIRFKTLLDQYNESTASLKNTQDALLRYKTAFSHRTKELFHERKVLNQSLKELTVLISDRMKKQKQINRLHEINNQVYHALVDVLYSIIESKKQYHQGHSKKVSEISAFIAQEMNLSKSEIEDIRIAGLLHEIGKMTIPDELTVKHPTHYSYQEKIQFMRHPIVGAALLKDIVHFKKISTIIEHLHENYAGNGIPDGLKKEKIPIGSRIIAAVSCYDNLVYRTQNSSLDMAFQFMEDHINQEFDIQVVNYLYKYVSLHPLTETDSTVALRIYELKPGMILASSIFTSNGAKLLPKNSVLTQESIQKMLRHYESEYVEEIVYIRG